ncbi:MAG: L-asparaginase, partial [Betaproteobacteria bacterium]|nr:L-asparaginase [Betaproteobacteria bacterium]
MKTAVHEVQARDDQSALPLVWLLSTGGTIAGQGASSTSLTEYRGSTLLGSELLASVPEIARYAEVRVEQVANVSSPNMTVEVWRSLAQRIDSIFSADPRVAGIVITHGTSTLEETAYFLHLTVRHDRPVVVVGSQRPATAISADGPLNLLNAVRTAAAPQARGKGVLVVMNDEINGAREVTKSNTYRVETFRSGELGFLGYVDEDRVTFYRMSTRRHTVDSEFDVLNLANFPRVEMVASYADSSVAPLHALAREGVDGIIIAAPGAGSLSDAEVAAIKEVLARPGAPIVVRSSRTGNGRVTRRKAFDALGLIPSDNLSPQKARILLMLALSKTREPEEIARIFDEY